MQVDRLVQATKVVEELESMGCHFSREDQEDGFTLVGPKEHLPDGVEDKLVAFADEITTILRGREDRLKGAFFVSGPGTSQ